MAAPYEPGTQVGTWRVESLLDDGPTTVTYKVQGDVDGQERAAVLRLLKIKDPTFAERLIRNAQALAADRENLVPVHGVVEHEGFTGVASAWIDGPDLFTWSQSDAPLSHRLALFEDIMAGLDQAHRAGLVHRNLKPGKIRVAIGPDAPARAYLEDFLLSRMVLETGKGLTGIGVTFGTPQYMSPEQFHGAADVTARGDLFSAGCVLYELVTGKRAFDGGSIRDVYMAIIDGEYTDPKELRPDLPDAVVVLLRDLLEPATEDRPESASAVLDRLRGDEMSAWIERPPPARPPAPPSFPTLLAPEEGDESESSAPVPASQADTELGDDPLPVRASNKTLWLVAGFAFGAGMVGSFLMVLTLVSLFARS